MTAPGTESGLSMRHSRTVWHYGLMAEYWALFKRDAPELPGLVAHIRRHGQPVLDLCCGAGRILLALLREGMDVDGVDVSEDMIAQATAAAAREGFAPALYAQRMFRFATDRSYRSIVIVDSFGLGGDRGKDFATLQGCRAALQPGGALILNIQTEYTSSGEWALWTKEGRSRLPERWPETPIERVAPNGDVYRLRIRAVAASPMRQTYTREMRIEKWIGGEMAAQETATLVGNMYLPSEVGALLREAGFARVELFSGFTDSPATDESGDVVFVAEATCAS